MKKRTEVLEGYAVFIPGPLSSLALDGTGGRAAFQFLKHAEIFMNKLAPHLPDRKLKVVECKVTYEYQEPE